MNNHLWEGDLYAILVEKNLQVSRQHPLSGKEIVFGDIHRKFQINATIGQLLHAQIARNGELQAWMRFFQLGQFLTQHFFQLAQIGAVGNSYHT